MTQGTAVAKTAKSGRIVAADGSFALGGMLQDTGGIATGLALAALGHLGLVILVQKLTGIALGARGGQPVTTHFTFMNALEFLPRRRFGHGFKVKAWLHLYDFKMQQF